MVLSEEQQVERVTRLIVHANIKRTTAVSAIRAVHTLSQRVASEPDIVPEFLIAVAELDALWAQFKSEDDVILEYLVTLNKVEDYSPDMPTEVRALINVSRSVAAKVRPTGAEVIDLSYLHKRLPSKGDDDRLPSTFAQQGTSRPLSRLPDIPLPQFDGDYRYWPTFRDLFVALVDQRANVCNIDKLHYLIGCLTGPAADAVRGIPLCADNYALVWSTLATRFNRPRLVATSLVDKLLRAPPVAQESLTELNNFLCLFSEGLSLLDALKIPDIGSFIWFSVAFRSLPISTRKLFETSTKSDYPSIKELMEFLQERVAVLEVVGEPRKIPTPVTQPKGSSQPGPFRRGGDRAGKPSYSHPTALVTSKSSNPGNMTCPCCQGAHGLGSCARFKGWAGDERSRWTREKKLCFNCFSLEHWAHKCTSKARCQDCSRRHHHLLHPPTKTPGDSDDVSRSELVLCASTAPRPPTRAPSVMLGTALVHVRDRAGTWQTMRALIDCASEISVITAACADRLGLRREPWTTPVTGLSGVPIMEVQGRVECVVQPRYATEPVLNVHAWVLPAITGDLPRNQLPATLKNRFSNLALADPSFHIKSPVDLLLGGDVYATVMDGRKIIVDKNLPAAFSSIFGWVLMGAVSEIEYEVYRSLPVALTVSLEGLMHQFWHVEEPQAAPETFTDDGRCEQIFRDKCVRLPSGRFAVPLPFRIPVSDKMFPRSRETAVKRFESLERKLASDPKLKALYSAFMSEYLALGHMSVAKTPGRYYIPHHAICKVEGGATKIRVVFDASAKCLSGMSLNDALCPGPKLQREIVDIIVRFRLFRHAFTADICKMYRQIMILPEFRGFQHIMWRESPHDQLVEYELNTVTYGVNCAPFLALRVLRAIADREGEAFPLVREALCYQTYVDDICYGADTVADVVAIQRDLNAVLARSGLELRKWASNTPEILRAVPTDHRAVKSSSFADDDGVGTKVLGVCWHPNRDHLSCELRLEPTITFTKRGILSLTARFFDPLGLFAPAIFLAKFIMQRTWQATCTWDGPLPSDIHNDWAQFVSELPQLSAVCIPRFCNTTPSSACLLFGFCDASLRGYAAVVYLRVLDAPRDSSVFLIGTKTKLAPIKPLTVPRLELNAALLLARWMHRLKTVLGERVTIVDSFAWTDSLVVLSWLTVPHETFKQYVSNRVYQIQHILPGCHWRYVSTHQNPADCASRGLMPSELPRHVLYWSGPQFLYDNPDKWGNDRERLARLELPELRPVTLTVQGTDQPSEWFVCFSSFDRMIRVVAQMRRFIERCRHRALSPAQPGYLCKSELDKATRILVIESQRVHFAVLLRELCRGNRVSSKPLSRLSPFIDADGVLRVGGRLRHSLLSYDCKFPILLAKRSHFAWLICQRWHILTCHSGPRILTALISRQHWVVSLRSVLHKVMTKCTTCVRLNPKPFQPIMADLPADRVQPCRPFARVGIDYAGPLQMRELRLRKSRIFKVYIAVFVCMSVKAVHIEVVTELSTDAFLAAFDRFVARRGLPTDVYSDCGTNFIGANKQLHALINGPAGQISVANARAHCHWHFNPPGAPHFGGLWEAAVRSTKRLLARVIGTHIFTYEEFTTVLNRIEAVLNSRPLTPASNDPHDLDCLTPGHFLIGQPLIAVPPRSSSDSTRDLSNRWKLLDQCHQVFWRRWTAEYLTTLQERSKWTNATPNIKKGDMVVIVDNQTPPLMWRLGRVTELYPGPDEVVRVAQVLTQTGHLTRPVVKLVPLPTT